MSHLVNNSSPIGVYDSGVGGLSVLRALRELLPGESFAYVADSANAPYGDRSPEFLLSRAHEVAQFFTNCNAKALVLACNTASVVAAQHLRKLHALPIVAMEPAIKPAINLTQSKVILVLATTNTIKSQSVVRLCQTYGQGVRIILQPCPGLADQVERHQLHELKTRQLLEQFIRPAITEGADTIVLGCTHYAFLTQQISAVAGQTVTVVEPSAAIARQLSSLLPTPLTAKNSNATTAFYTSGCASSMQNFLNAIGEPSELVYHFPATSFNHKLEVSHQAPGKLSRY